MCGIAGVWVKDPGCYDHARLEVLLDELLLGIEHRGRDATGVASVRPGSPDYFLEKADIEASKFVYWRRPLVINPRVVIAHTRAATKGSKMNLDNDHPVEYEGVLVTHNGHISNDDELFKEHEFTRIGQVDTEIIPALFWKHGIDKAHLALQALRGNFAVAVIDPRRAPDTLLLAKGPSSPLEYVETDKLIVWASEREVIRKAWKATFGGKEPKKDRWNSLNPGDIRIVTPSGIEKLKFEVNWATRSTTSTGWNGGAYQTEWDRKKAKYEALTCTCGHNGWRHTGVACDGDCLDRTCGCKKFVEKPAEAYVQDSFLITINGEQKIWTQCAWCERYDDTDDMSDPFGSGFLFCERCIPDDVQGSDDDDDDIIGAEVIHLPFSHVNPDIVEHLDYDTKRQGFVLESDKHDEVVLRTADALDCHESWVSWLLWECSNEELEYCEADYIEVHDEYQNQLLRYLEEQEAHRLGGDSSCGVKTFDEEVA